jgi:2-keto-myo-inositol isomerase
VINLELIRSTEKAAHLAPIPGNVPMAPIEGTRTKICVSEATTLPLSFADDVTAYAGAGCKAMEVWLTKLEDHLAHHSIVETQALLAEHSMALVAAAYQGGLLLSEGEARKAHNDHFKRRLDICQQFNIPVLVLVPDFNQAIDVGSIEHAVHSLAQAGQWAAAFGRRLALEFRSSATFANNLGTALDLIERCFEPSVGLNLDVFHYYTGPSKVEDLKRLTVSNLFHVQLCDLSGVPRELARDSDRVLPGEGDIGLGPILERLQAIGYDGWLSLELMNPTLWKTKPAQVVELGMTAMRRCLERAGCGG